MRDPVKEKIQSLCPDVMELWEGVDDYGGFYDVSNLGNVRSYYYNRYGVTTRTTLMKASLAGNGYRYVRLYKDKKHRLIKVSRLVAGAFIKNPKSLPVVNHKNGIKTEDRASNLEWVTSSENSLHAFRTGLNVSKKGTETAQNKLTERQVKKIRALSGLSTRKIGEMFGVSHTVVRRIRNRILWKHI